MAGVLSYESGMVSGGLVGDPASAGHSSSELLAAGQSTMNPSHSLKFIEHFFDFSQERAALGFIFDRRAAFELL
jgi:hypothetical protein